MTERAGSLFACRYAQAAAGERLEYVFRDYDRGVRMRFTLNDGAAMLDCLRHGQPGSFFQGMADWLRAKEALPGGLFVSVQGFTWRQVYTAIRRSLSRG